MNVSPSPVDIALAQGVAALQHGPRPLPLFLDMLWKETHGDDALRTRALQGLRRYQEAVRVDFRCATSVHAAAGGSTLLRPADAKDGETDRAPVVLIPSLINPPRILDLSPGRSLLRHMADAGHDVFLVDWGTPIASEGGAHSPLDLTGYVTERLLPLLAAIGRPPILIGYCLGGTLALGAARAAGARGVAAIASPWHLGRMPAADREQILTLWEKSQPVCERLGYVPMEVLQAGFWALEPARTIRKYAAFADMAPGSDAETAFLAVEDWANAGAPLSFAAAQELFERFYRDDMAGQGLWAIAGERVDPAALPCPGFAIRSSSDRIVPANITPALDKVLTLGTGHVGMMIGSRAPDTLWQPLCEWVSAIGG